MIHNRLSAMKDKLGLTNQQISDRSGIPLSTVTRIFNGQTDNPAYHTVAEIVIAMGGSLDDLEGIERPVEKTPDKVIQMYEKQIEEKELWIKKLFILIVVMTSIFVAILILDVLNGNIGFFRY